MSDIEILNAFPDNPGPSSKVPTAIAYQSENEAFGIQRDEWGFSCRGGMKSYHWTKLLLDTKAIRGKFDDEQLTSYFGPGFMTLPKGKTAKAVASDFMKHLHEHLCARLTQKGVRLSVTCMEVWITVPAIWYGY
jgi:hypothetical protein